MQAHWLLIEQEPIEISQGPIILRHLEFHDRILYLQSFSTLPLKKKSIKIQYPPLKMLN